MSRVLFAWELGGNYGHLLRQLPLANRLRKLGHDVFFAVRHTAVAAQLLAPQEFTYTQAPLNTAGRQLENPPVNYADMLIAEGYANTSVLQGQVQGWCSLIKLYQPSLVVADHAPTALFSAYLVDVPTIIIGTGFEIPPGQSPLPSIRPWEAIPGDRLLRAEECVLDRLNKIAALHQKPPLNRITELFQKAGNLLATFPELDHYGVRNGESYAGPIFAHATGEPIAWTLAGKPQVFAYVHPTVPGFESLLQALYLLQAEVIVVALGISPARIRDKARPGFRVLTKPVMLDQLLGTASLIITSGGTGMASQALLSGVPLLIVPQNVEQFLMGQRVETLGMGLAVRQKRRVEDFTELLHRLLTHSQYQEAASVFAQKYHVFRPGQVVDEAMLKIGKLLQDNP